MSLPDLLVFKSRSGPERVYVSDRSDPSDRFMASFRNGAWEKGPKFTLDELHSDFIVEEGEDAQELKRKALEALK